MSMRQGHVNSTNPTTSTPSRQSPESAISEWVWFEPSGVDCSSESWRELRKHMQTFDDSSIFVNEDMSKPENRVNVALFGLMSQDWFRMWLLEMLGLPADSIIYPPTNSRGSRPDLAVSAPGRSGTLAWIEIELATNVGQIADYRSRYSEAVKSIWGRREDCGDLSLEEIEEFLGERMDSLQPQVQINVKRLRKLIRQGLDGHSRSGGRTEISEEMRNHPLVAGLICRLGDSLKITAGRIGPGELKADAIGESGFLVADLQFETHGTVGVPVEYQGRKSGGHVSHQGMARNISSTAIPHRHRRLRDSVEGKALHIDDGKVHWYAGSLHVDVALAMIDDLTECVLAFADYPRLDTRAG